MVVVELSSRVEALKKALLDNVHAQYRSFDELTILTDEKVKNEPLIVRKAKALALVLEKMPVHIMDRELIVGMKTMVFNMIDQSRRGTTNWETKYDPITNRWKFPHYATDEEKKEAMKEDLPEGWVMNHMSPMWKIPLTIGLGGVKAQAKKKLKGLKNTPANKKKREFLRAVIIALNGASTFIKRYANEAHKLAGQEVDKERRNELEEIARICDWISTNKARTFYEAVQLFWLLYCVSYTEMYDWLELGRFDQYMYPFYKKDLKEGKMTEEKTRELLECLWIKFNETDDLNADTGKQIMLGGQTRDGKDATNDLTYICLDVTEKLHLVDPKISVRVHRGTPEALLEKACEVEKTGCGSPGFYNDEVIVPSWTRIGLPVADALEYTNDGCFEPIIDGKSYNWPTHATISPLKILENTLKRLEEYETFEDLMNAYKKNIAHEMKNGSKGVDKLNAKDAFVIHTGFGAVPFTSSFTEACLEKMKDLSEGGAVYNYTGFKASGIANVADSLAAVKKFVYDEKKISRKELVEVLARNYEGYERLRQMLINGAPKFGNDNDYVDFIARDVVTFFCKETRKYRNPRGGEYIPLLSTWGTYITEGLETGATPDGRKAGDFIANSFSPMNGVTKVGPYAVVKSQAKVDLFQLPDGAALDLKFHPSAVGGPEGTRKLMAFIKAWMDADGMIINGINIVDAKTLRDAQKHPEKYKDLTVRVWGFTAYFVNLAPEYQEHVITRTEHAL